VFSSLPFIDNVSIHCLYKKRLLLPVPELLKKTARKYIQDSWKCALGSRN